MTQSSGELTASGFSYAPSQPLPDLLGAFISHTQTTTATYTLANGRITAIRPRIQSESDPTGWLMPTYAIVYMLVTGPIMPRMGRVPFRSQNVQVDCYGPDLRTANLLYRTWYADFYPSLPFIPQGFIAAHCSIASLEEVGSSIALFGGENIWPKVTSTHLVKYFEIPTT